MPPDQLSAFLDRYFALLFGVVERHGGLVTDVVGDGMTCIWSAARPDRGCCRSACLAALEIERRDRRVQPRVRAAWRCRPGSASTPAG